MSRQTRRSTTVADAADVSLMDPWKDDRCRDFLALNTIQRLRSYHEETMLPVDPVNSVRARNLVMLPKPEPLGRTCDTDAGCAIDTARILFFGPTSFLNPTSYGRATASPHAGSGGGHSGSHARFCPSDDTAAKANVGLSPRHEPMDPNAKSNDIAHAIDAGATPLRLNTKDGRDTALTPSPRPRRLLDGNGDGGLAEGNVESSMANNNDYNDGDIDQTAQSGVVGGVAMGSSAAPAETPRFSCAIVETLTAYYQSLLSRGVVLDRFNAKDLAFAWWVVGRNMDVSALNRQGGSMRRDALLILVRHFYYELLTEQRLKKELSVKEVPAEEEVLAETEKPISGNIDNSINQKNNDNNNNNNKNSSRSSSSSSNDNPENDDASEAMHKEEHAEAEGTSVRHTATEKTTVSNNNNSSSGCKRTRSRLEPTRTSASAVGSRLRRQPLEKQSQPQEPKEQQTQEQEKPQLEQPQPVADVGSSASANPPALSGAEEQRGAEAALRPAAPEKTSRPPRGANIEEVWRPLRATRRRPPTPEDSVDFAAASEKVRVDPLTLVAERIRRRVAQDPVYAALATAFPNASGHSGMHPALLQLLRYVHHAAEGTDDAGAPIASESPLDVKREDGDEEEELTRSGENAVGGALEEEEEEEEEEERREEQEQRLREPEQRVDWEGYMRYVAAQMAGARLRRHCSGRRNVLKSSESGEGNDSNEDRNDDEAEEGEEEEEEETNADDASDDDDSKAPVVRPPCQFSALTYAQQCLLTWEAADILDPRRSVAAMRRKKRERERKNKRRQRQRQQQNGSPDEKADEGVGTHRPPREFYDYWRNP